MLDKVSGQEYNVAEAYVKKILDDFIEEARVNLDLIQESLKDLVERIKKEKPDVIFFLDKGARIFALPIHKILRESMEHPPQIMFTNDKQFKYKYYIKDNLDDEDIIDKYNSIKDKKVFFIDETFSAGIGAAVVKRIKQALGNDQISYFALSIDEEKGSALYKDNEISLEQHEENIRELLTDDHFNIYPNQINKLFSKDLAAYYVDDVFDANSDLYRTAAYKTDQEDNLVEARESMVNAPELDIAQEAIGVSSKEIAAEFKKRIHRTIKQIQGMIYESIES